MLFFTPPSLSVPSRIPHFPSMAPFYHQISKHPHSPHYFLTIHHLHHNKQTFINFYHQTLLIPHKKPNILHQSIPQLQN
ncbi:Sir2 family NAD-dependent protein deacetylase, partial [Staphylococcus epidermidis]|uniref:Sir2 family NAD-dependent protein deacetylase n=1 Tax=Staphylococcus epidermidis TaxID=1282 RepID=UPI0028CB9E6F